MNNLTNTNFLADFADIDNMDVDQCRCELAGMLGLQARNLLRMACLVRRLESLGDDLSGLKIGLLHHLRRIACGQLLPEIVVRFAAKPSLIAMIGSLPIEDQRMLAEGKTVRMLTYGPDGKITHRVADPMLLTPQQVRQVFARDHLRDDAEQALLLDQQAQKLKQKRLERVGKMRIDYERGGVVVGHTLIVLADLVTAVKELQGIRA